MYTLDTIATGAEKGLTNSLPPPKSRSTSAPRPPAKAARWPAMVLSDFEYTAAWSVGSLVTFGLLTIGCKQIPAFGASPSFAAHMIVHVFLVCVICHHAGLTSCAPLSALSAYHRLCPSGLGRALLPSPARAQGDRLDALVSPAQFAHHLTQCCTA